MTDIDMAAIEILAEQYRRARTEANLATQKKERLGAKLKRAMLETGEVVDCPGGRGKFVLRRSKGRLVVDNPDAVIDAGLGHIGEDVVSLVWEDYSDEEFARYLKAIERGVA